MSELVQLAGYGLAGVLALMVIAWAVSVRLRDASIVDRLWGFTFVLQVWIYAALTGADGLVPRLLVVLVSVWGLRLSFHIHLRNRGSGEDYRYERMREKHGARFWWVSLFTVFGLQAGLSFVVAAPLLFVMARGEPVNGMLFVWLGIVLWLVGFVFESLGDWQLARFKANPDNEGKLLTRGLWSLTRHPNYFGDATLWWGYWLIAVSVAGGWMSFFGPALMSLLIRYVSGVAMLEKDQIEKRPEYADYIRSTPAFFPRISLPGTGQ